MTITQKLQELIEQARKGGSPPAPIYTVALGEIQLAGGRKKELDNDAQVSILRKLVKNNEEGIRLSNKQSFKDALQKENDLLRAILPAELTAEELMRTLANEDIERIRSAPADGAAIGILMKLVKDLPVKPSSETVKAVVVNLRSISG